MGPIGDIVEHLAYDTRCAKFYYKHESFLNDFVEQNQLHKQTKIYHFKKLL